MAATRLLAWTRQASPGRTRTLAGPGPAARRGRVTRSKRMRLLAGLAVFGSADGRPESWVRDCKALPYFLSAGPKRIAC